MNSLIEQASRRLEQLRQAGVQVPEAPVSAAVPTEPVGASPAVPDDQPTADKLQHSAARSRQVELDLDALVAAGLVSPNAPRSQIADEYRVIKRPLIANAMGKGAEPIVNGNLIMVTSALAGEGKSFTALNLAMSIATELDNTVMLVDADVARPSLLRMLGLPAGPGLLDLLVNRDVDLSKVLLRTNIDKFSILPSGTPHARATELLASDAMIELVKDIARRYSDRIVIFDSPPLLLTTESRVLASHMGQIVMVVQAEKTLQRDVQSALATIDNCPVKMLVLNQAGSGARGGYGYGQGYGYGYGYGYGSPA
jgi:protein-tyrosine kinase